MLESKTNAIVKAISDLKAEMDYSVQISHISFMFELFFTLSSVYEYRSAKTAGVARFKTYRRKLLENGTYIARSEFETCFVSEARTRQDIDQTKEVIAYSLRSIAG